MFVKDESLASTSSFKPLNGRYDEPKRNDTITTLGLEVARLPIAHSDDTIRSAQRHWSMDATEERRPPIMTIEVVGRVYNVCYSCRRA